MIESISLWPEGRWRSSWPGRFATRRRAALLGRDAIIGFSTHNLEQARLAAQMPIDYVAIGPIFSTTTKESDKSTSRSRWISARPRGSRRDAPGRNWRHYQANVSAVIECRRGCVAVISDIWMPAQSIRREKIKRLIKLLITDSRVNNRFFLRLASLCARILAPRVELPSGNPPTSLR